MSQPNCSLRHRDELLRLGRALFDLEPRVDVWVFSRKITMSTSSGCFTGDGTPGNQRTGRRAHVQVEDLAQRDVQRPDAAADRRGGSGP